MTRGQKALVNTLITILYQFIVAVCGFIVPKLLLNTFGSELYGVTTSITQFLSYITLLEAGVGGVAKAALYKPLADNDVNALSHVMDETRSFFNKIGFVYIGYVFFVASTFKLLKSGISIDFQTTFLLTMVISISTLFQYFWGIPQALLVTADQKNYINISVSILTVILNALLTYVLVLLDMNLIIIKLASSIVYVIRPLFLNVYVNRKYRIIKVEHSKTVTYLNQKRDALGQHIAFFLHTNTDVFVITLCMNATEVAVYAVYRLVTASLQTIVISFSSAVEATFGNMLANKENENLKESFDLIEFINSNITVICFATAAIMIIPFVEIYTRGITDARYIRPAFAIIYLIAEAYYCISQPYSRVITAAGHFKETKIAAWIEAFLNISISFLTVFQYGIIGVAIGTLIATMFRTTYYAVYLSKNILYVSTRGYIKRIITIIINWIMISVGMIPVLGRITIHTFFQWGMWACVAFIYVSIVTIIVDSVFYKKQLHYILKKIIHK